MNLFLEIFLYVDVFIIGVVASIAFRHARAHYRPRHESKTTQLHPSEQPLSKELREKLTLEAEAKYQKQLEAAVEHLSKELGITSDKINQVVDKLSADLLSREKAAYEHILKEYQQQAEAKLDAAKSESVSYQAELKAKLDETAASEKQRLITLIDNKLADSLMAFILEAMGHEVDLGAQEPYLLKVLEEHKDEFKRAVNS